jgi:primosomal protein N' (replication factor Y)
VTDELFPSSPTAPPVGRRLVRVVVERGIERADFGVDGLTYALPDQWPPVPVGSRVEVPLGRGNNLVQGVVVEADAGGEPGPAQTRKGLKAVTRVVGSAFPASLVDLARWVSRYYCCPLGMVLSAMVPSAVKRQTGKTTQVVLERVPDATPTSPLTPMVKAAWEALEELPAKSLPMPAKELALVLGQKSVAGVNRLLALGLLRESVREGVRARGWEDSVSSDGDGTPPTLTPDQARAVDAVTGTLGTFRPHLLLGVTGSGKTEVYLRVLEQVMARGESAVVLVPEISLTPQTAGRFLSRFGGKGGAGVAVLHSGLTASQRHQQWTRVAKGEARVVVGARSAVFAPFPDRTDPATAEFKRFPLGLIIVDEEHDHSYKQDQMPRYHARDVALRRAQRAACPVILGSATPSLESWHNAYELRRFNLIELPSRVGGGRLPRVDIVDMVEERRARTGPDARMLHSIGPKLQGAIGTTLDAGGQVILLLNRRGYASYVSCPDHRCGWLMTCKYCDVTMVYHRAKWSSGQVAKWPSEDEVRASGHSITRPLDHLPLCRCHHCLAEQSLPVQCPLCAKRINTFGFGTQRLEEELGRKFDSLVLGDTMLRLDADTMTRASDYFDALERFRRGSVRLLLGTQMISKGLDFPNVRLVGVINADTALNLPDFRASERTFQLVAQVAGRAGRGEREMSRDGHTPLDRVIVQTFNPTEPSITAAAAHDFRAFASRELLMRTQTGLPPTGRMARIVCRDENPAKAEASASRIATALRAPPVTAGGDSSWVGQLRVKGPMPCPISRVAGYFRVSVEMLAPSAMVIQAALTAVRNLGLVKSDEHTAVDVDPVALL